MNIRYALYCLFVFFLSFSIRTSDIKNTKYEKVLFLDDMYVIKKNNEGANHVTLYKDINGKIWFVKKLLNESNAQNSLVSSVLASKLINLIMPGSAPIVLPAIENKTGKIFIASLMLDGFKRKNEKTNENEKYGILLNFILDLLEIEDRHGDNIGSVPEGEDVKAAAVDLDMGLKFSGSWIQKEWKELANSKNIDEIESSLKKIAAIPDNTIKTLLFDAMHDLEVTYSNFIPVAKYKFETMIDTVYIVDQVIEIKHQMNYLAKNIKLIANILNYKSNNCANIKDDSYAIFLQVEIIKGKTQCAQALLERGPKESQGYALKFAIEKEDFGLTQMLIDRGAKDLDGSALNVAIRKGNFEIAQKLLDHGAQDPFGYAISAAIEQGNFAFEQKLLDHGAPDPFGNVLIAAIWKGNFAFAEKLLDRTALVSKLGDVLPAVIWKGNFAFAQKLLDRGAPDPFGNSLIAAIRQGNFAFAQKLLDHRAQDPFGNALVAAIRQGNFAFAQKLLDYGAQDPSGKALIAAIEQDNFLFAQKLFDDDVKDLYKNELTLRLVLVAAIKQGDFAFAKKLLAHGAQDPYGDALQAVREQPKFSSEQKEQLIQQLSIK